LRTRREGAIGLRTEDHDPVLATRRGRRPALRRSLRPWSLARRWLHAGMYAHASRSGKKNFLLALLPAMPAQIFPSVSVVCPANGLSGYFFVAEGSLPHCPSTPFARQVQASRPPLLRMLSLRIGPLLAPLSVWRRPLSVDTCPLVMTYKANTGQTRRFLQCIEPGGKPPSPRRSRRSDFPSRLIQSDCRV
jgi:hypothetical protein